MEELYKNKLGLLHVSHYATVLFKSSQKIYAMLISALIMHVWLVLECLEGVNWAVGA
jgi:hypothetical protein